MELKEIADLTEQDFEAHPVWRIARHTESGIDPGVEINERTFSPWKEQITQEIIWPHSQVLVAGRFHFADRDTHPGFFLLVGANWDDPLPPRRMRGGSFAKPLQWSARRGGGELSILSLLAPCVFVKGALLDFHIRRVRQVQETHVRVFYMQIAKTPSETFPVSFETNHGISSTVNSGTIPGFYRFPLDQPHEISTDEDIWSKFASR
jgi:hypothetical protein